MIYLIILTGILSSFNLCNGYRLLLVFPYPSRSHAILGEGYVDHLTKAGHDVTYVTSYPIMNPPAKLRQIDVSRNLEILDEITPEFTIENLIDNKIELMNIPNLLNNILKITNDTVSHKSVQEMLHDPKVDFDAVIVEWMYSELYAGFSSVFNCPFIWSSSLEPHSLVLSLIDDIPDPAYTPDVMSSSESPFSFFDRTKELFIVLAFKFAKLFIVSKEEEVFRNAFGPAAAMRGLTLPSLEEIRYNASLMLGNSHSTLGLAIHLPQNYKSIGGYHISDEVKPLPKEIKILLDNAINGVIYFSLGTVMESKTLPMVIKKDLLKMFGELKQTVIWKFEEVLSDLPSNVHIMQWAPQQSILGHPNCVLFITHGGLLSITESLHFGVPIIGVPLLADQFNNVKRVTNNGFGVGVDMNYETPKNLKIALKEVLENSRYSEKVKELSMAYHDRVISPGAELVHWVEHVIRTRGASHLRSPALLVPWYQKLYLDLITLIIIVIFLIIKIVNCFLFQLLYKYKHLDLDNKNK